jgi:2-polyprenyl-6-hydroxyphenyl methylase/3-demethylubiquinone-9 3-methyltransferase
MSTQPKLAACLWYDGCAEQAARFYAETFPESRIVRVHRAPADWPAGKAGDVLLVECIVAGSAFVAMNGGPGTPFNEAISFQLFTDDQAETDRLWEAITSNGGAEVACGWCRDRWGVRWQVVPRALMTAIADPDPAAAARAMQAMGAMVKIDIAAIEAARSGATA